MDARLRLSLPDEPGVYRLQRSNDDVLYVGKARSLKRRVNSYFHKRKGHEERTLEMLAQVDHLDVTVTGSALEAALLENDEIKRLEPPYNVALQGRDRRICFADPDLEGFTSAPDATHPIGPLPWGGWLRQLSGLGRLWTDGLDPDHRRETQCEVLGVFAMRAPDDACFEAGLERLRDRLEVPPHDEPWGGRLVRLGGQLQRALWTAQPPELDPLQSSEEPGNSRDRVWTPDLVCHQLQELLLRASRALRRARWVCLLSESSLAWTARRRDPERNVLLVIEGGSISHRQQVPRGTPLPIPPGWGRAERARQESMDLATYDRLRVLGSEISRLLGEEANLALRLGPNPAWDEAKVRAVAQWS